MNKEELFSRIDYVIDDAKTAILATTDEDGSPHMRWMTPMILPYRPGIIFACTVPGTPKVDQINQNREVEWIFQTKDLREVINIKAKADIIENPSLKAELMESAGSRLTAFWKANIGKEDFVIIQSVIEKAMYFLPAKGKREFVDFQGKG